MKKNVSDPIPCTNSIQLQTCMPKRQASHKLFLQWLQNNPQSQTSHSAHDIKHLCLQDEFALLVLLTSFIRLVVLPANDAMAFFALNVTNQMFTSRHVALCLLAFLYVDYRVEEVGFAMLTSEVLWQ